MRRTPARILRHHRQRREHRRQRAEMVWLTLRVATTMDRAALEILAAVDAKVATLKAWIEKQLARRGKR